MAWPKMRAGHGKSDTTRPNLTPAEVIRSCSGAELRGMIAALEFVHVPDNIANDLDALPEHRIRSLFDTLALHTRTMLLFAKAERARRGRPGR
jgi:hypothetical protein